MALIGNHSVLTKVPCKFLAGSTTAVESQVRSNWQNSARMRGVILRDGQTTAYNNMAYPGGYYPSYTWMIPQIAGQIGVSAGLMLGFGDTATENLAGGMYIAASLTGSGDTTLENLSVLGNLSTNLTGSANITTASLSGSLSAVANLTGSGSVAASLGGSLSASASLSGSGDITASSLTNATLLLTASISGSGDITTASLTNATLLLTAALSGSGSISATPIAPGSLSAAIKSYGDLTPQGPTDAVWNALLSNYATAGSAGAQLSAAGAGGNPWATVIEGGYTAEELLRLMASALFGKVSGAPGTTITFRDTGDSTNRITATVDSNGNRTTITLNPS